MEDIKHELLSKIYALILSVSELDDTQVNRDIICKVLIRSRETTERIRGKKLTFIDTPIYVAAKTLSENQNIKSTGEFVKLAMAKSTDLSFSSANKVLNNEAINFKTPWRIKHNTKQDKEERPEVPPPEDNSTEMLAKFVSTMYEGYSLLQKRVEALERHVHPGTCEPPVLLQPLYNKPEEKGENGK